jgi:hypothetical protein
MAQYADTKEAAEKRIKSTHSASGRAPVFFGKIQFPGGGERWIIDYEDRDYGGANFKVLEDHSHRIDQIVA